MFHNKIPAAAQPLISHRRSCLIAVVLVTSPTNKSCCCANGEEHPADDHESTKHSGSPLLRPDPVNILHAIAVRSSVITPNCRLNLQSSVFLCERLTQSICISVTYDFGMKYACFSLINLPNCGINYAPLTHSDHRDRNASRTDYF